MNNLTDWIVAISAVVALYFSYKSVQKSIKSEKEIIAVNQKLTLEINQVKQDLTTIKQGSNSNYIGKIENANNNGVAGVIINGQ